MEVPGKKTFRQVIQQGEMVRWQWQWSVFTQFSVFACSGYFAKSERTFGFRKLRVPS